MYPISYPVFNLHISHEPLMKRNLHIENINSVVCDINLTNLIDVILVILIIYILITPFINQGIELSLPQGSPAKIKKPSDIIISVTKAGDIYLDNIKVSREKLPDIIRSKQKDRDSAIIIKADKDLPYGVVIEILDLLNTSGIQNVGLATRPKDRQ